MAHLAEALGELGITVKYIVNEPMSSKREGTGWVVPTFSCAELMIADDRVAVKRIARSASTDSVHLCQGIRANRLVGFAQVELAERGLRQWAIMESVDDLGISGSVKRALYRRLLEKRKNVLEGILAIGWRTKAWVAARGFPEERIFPFAYYLSASIRKVERNSEIGSSFKFIFVGQLIRRKNVDKLLTALALCKNHEFELTVIGDGPARNSLECLAMKLRLRVRWLGKMPMVEIPQHIANADCLVLPSRHDGWGAVVVESLLVGTPVICSNTCGSAGVARASGFGGVFATNDISGLLGLLDKVLSTGPIELSLRTRLRAWAKFLTARHGADYLKGLLYSDTTSREHVAIPPDNEI